MQLMEISFVFHSNRRVLPPPPALLFNGLRESIVTTPLQGFILFKDYRFSNVLRPAGTVIMKIEAVPGIKVPGAMTYHVHIAL